MVKLNGQISPNIRRHLNNTNTRWHLNFARTFPSFFFFFFWKCCVIFLCCWVVKKKKHSLSSYLRLLLLPLSLWTWRTIVFLLLHLHNFFFSRLKYIFCNSEPFPKWLSHPNHLSSFYVPSESSLICQRSFFILERSRLFTVFFVVELPNL